MVMPRFSIVSSVLSLSRGSEAVDPIRATIFGACRTVIINVKKGLKFFHGDE